MPSDHYTYELLDTWDAVLGPLGGVQPGGVIQSSISAAPRTSGTIQIAAPREPIDWLTRRIRVSHNGRALITAVPAIKSEQHTATGAQLQIDLYDATVILQDDTFGGVYALAAGTTIITAVQSIIASAGLTKTAIPPSSATLSATMAWDAATTKLRIVNDLLTAAGYWAIWADPDGWLRAEPYLPPAQRPVRFSFEAGGTADRYLPAFARNTDPFSVPNRVRVVGATDGATEAATGEATDERPDSPFSYPRRGRWITHTETDVAAGNLTAYATRRLEELQQVYETHELTHPAGDFGLNDRGRFRDRDAVIIRQEYRLDVGGLVRSTLRTLL